VPAPSIRRLSLADLDQEALEQLVRYQLSSRLPT
jgi:hypothetical protein